MNKIEEYYREFIKKVTELPIDELGEYSREIGMVCHPDHIEAMIAYAGGNRVISKFDMNEPLRFYGWSKYEIEKKEKEMIPIGDGMYPAPLREGPRIGETVYTCYSQRNDFGKDEDDVNFRPCICSFKWKETPHDKAALAAGIVFRDFEDAKETMTALFKQLLPKNEENQND